MRKILAVVLLSLAGVLSVFEFIALVDPVGTQMADDLDPFGPPMPWHSPLVFIFVIIVLAFFSYRLLRTPLNKGMQPTRK